jgi:hypothetical protein
MTVKRSACWRSPTPGQCSTISTPGTRRASGRGGRLCPGRLHSIREMPTPLWPGDDAPALWRMAGL